MQRVLAIAWLTVKAAFRFRLVLALAALLLGGVILLPILIRDDGTAAGFTQIVLTYTLALITTLLGFATLWLACGTLARDIEECQMQMVVVKPIARWQIWFGKLSGILIVNAILLTFSAGAVFFLLQWRAQKLPLDQQDLLHNEVLVARGSLKPAVPDVEPAVEAQLKEILKRNPAAIQDLDYARRQIRERLKAGLQAVLPEYRIEWSLNVGLLKPLLQNRPLHLRYKFNAAQPSENGTYRGRWVVGGWEAPGAYRSDELSLSANSFHELALTKSNLISDEGKLNLAFVNLSDSVLLFPLDEGVEVLYREGGFGLNFARGVLIIFFWLSLLAALGLAAASFLSFPVAAFFSLGILIVGLSSGTISQIIEQGTVLQVNHETGRADAPSWIDYVALPIFRVLLRIINLVQGFSPIDSLSSGRSISWLQLGQAFLQVCIVLGGIFAVVGIFSFTRRELAAVQTAQ